VIFAPDKRDIGDWTLGEVWRCASLHVECARCWKISELLLPPLIDRFGEEATLDEVRRRMRCRKCRSRKARVLVRLRGVRGYRAWRPVVPNGGR
jgi:DNA-directed RNA polymerase subunit RPC12/RpoP